jgi:hypothetical protein
MKQELQPTLREFQNEFDVFRRRVARFASGVAKARPGDLANDLLTLSDWADAFAAKLAKIILAAGNQKSV